MNIDKIKEVLLKRDGLSNTLGMEFISTPAPDTCLLYTSDAADE